MFKYKKKSGPDFSAWLPRSRLINLLKHWSFGAVIDVGSHDGSWLASVVPHLNTNERFRMLLFDPLTSPSQEHLRLLKGFGHVVFHNFALGQSDRSALMNVASNNGESSSLLAFTKAHLDAAPDVQFTQEVVVSVQTLDGTLGAESDLGDDILLKIDAQGAEDDILAGASDLLDKVRIVVAEASLVPAYENGSTLFSTSTFLQSRGFELIGLVESFSEQNFGRMIQMDAIYCQAH